MPVGRLRQVSWGPLLTVLLALTLLAYGYIQLGDPVESLVDQSYTRIGNTAVSASDSVRDVAGASHPLLARDSLTLLLMLDAHCAVCRRNANDYLALSEWSASQGIATRVIVPNEVATAAQFGRLAGREAAIMIASPDLFVGRFRIFATPSSVLVDRRGVIRGRWLAGVPRHLELLNVSARIRG
jgi:hypothetical protein